LLFAITDIETTGGQPAGCGITEIAIVLHDGKNKLKEFHTLLNPMQPIPRYITALTGIDDTMIEDAPLFEEMADVIHALLADAVFVAHNVNFDYSFIRSQFTAIGMAWEPKKLCSVRLARKVFAGFASYSLGNLCRTLGVQNMAPHRALGDALATAEIFGKIFLELGEDELLNILKRGNPESFLPNNIDAKTYLNLPDKPGVYYLLDAKGKPLYIGKARNIRSRIKQHFSADREAQKLHGFMKEVYDLDYKLTGTELIALLLEDAEIRKYWPPYNRAQKSRAASWGVFDYHDQRGYLRLAVNKISKAIRPIKSFHSAITARNWLQEFSKQFDLDLHLVGMAPNFGSLPDTTEHNPKLQLALHDYFEQLPSYVLHAQGRSQDEKSFVLIEKGNLRGYGFTDSAISTMEELENNLELLPSSEVTQGIITAFLENPKGMRVLELVRKSELTE